MNIKRLIFNIWKAHIHYEKFQKHQGQMCKENLQKEYNTEKRQDH